MKATSPADFKDAARVDEALRRTGEKRGVKGTSLLHVRLKPVEEAVADYERELAQNPLQPGHANGAGNECAGVCFV